MAKTSATAHLAPEIRRKLAALRWRIRAYVLLQGASVAAIWLILTFWVGLAIDYLPVLLGASEMPRLARGLLLLVIALVLAYILYRWVLRRVFAQLADRSMALLLERQFRLGESLITSVEMSGDSESASPLGRQMLATTQLQALRNLHNLRVSRVLNFRPLLVYLGAAIAMLVTLGAFYVVNAHAFGLGAQRIYLLDDRPWPRSAQIEIVGVETTGLSMPGDVEQAVVPFSDRGVKVARGSSVSLIVRADGAADVVPQSCLITYRTAEGVRGRVNMTRVGQIRDGYQTYMYDGKPLKGILSDVHFDVLGFDHRIRNHVISVVDSPAVIHAELDCVFPEYMVDRATSSRLPQSVVLNSGTRLPRGTKVTLRAESNKPLRQARIRNPQLEQVDTVQHDTPSQEFDYSLGVLERDVTLEITLVDYDRVVSEKPYRVFVEAVEDLPPLVNLRLQGVGTAVTPEVLIGIDGEVTDDYGVGRSWIEILVDDSAPRNLPLAVSADRVAQQLDFRQLSRGEAAIRLEPGGRLRLAGKAQDLHNLAGGPHVGVSDVYQLDIVTPQQLLEMLEARELGLRQRFEQIIDEVRDTRDVLSRIKNESPASSAADASQPAERVEPRSVPQAEQADDRSWSLGLVRAQRTVLQSQKSAQETLGVAASFRDIADELVNNRIDSEDRRQRLQEQVASPLEQIVKVDFVELDQRLQQLVATMDHRQQAATVAAAETAIRQNATILLKLNDVLQNMMRLEDYNEVLDIVRSLIDEQEKLIGRTKEEQKKQLLRLFQ